MATVTKSLAKHRSGKSRVRTVSAELVEREVAKVRELIAAAEAEKAIRSEMRKTRRLLGRLPLARIQRDELEFAPGKKLRGGTLASALEQVAYRSSDVLGGVEHARTWLDSHPVPALGGKTSAKLIADGWGLAVLNYIDEMRYGSRG